MPNNGSGWGRFRMGRVYLRSYLLNRCSIIAQMEKTVIRAAELGIKGLGRREFDC